MEKVSIIIPIYNASKYMSICLDSMFSQTYKEIEIIVVNDKSSDDSLKLLKEYKTKHANLVIVDLQENKGVSNARNVGIMKSTGEYIYFIDCDDFLDKDAIKIMVSLSKKYQADVVDTERLFWYKRNEKILTFTERKQLKKDLILGNINNNRKAFTMPRYVTGKLFKREVIKNIKFDSNIRCYEDGLFNQEIKENFNNYIYAKGVFYHYLQRPSSLINTISTNHLDYIYVATKINNIYNKNEYYDLPIKKLIDNMIADDIIVILTSKIPLMKISMVQKKQYIREFLKLRKTLNLNKISLNRRITMSLFSNNIFNSCYLFIVSHINLVDLSFVFLNIFNKYKITNQKLMKKVKEIYIKMS